MYAVIETGGKQYRVEVGTELEVELLDAEPGKTITIDRVLLVADGDDSTIGRPLVADASVSAEIVTQTRGPKLISFKYRPKARSRVKKGHRQELTLLRVADINVGGKSAAKSARKAEEQAKTERQRTEEAAIAQAAKDAELAAKLAVGSDAPAPARKATKTKAKAETVTETESAADDKATSEATPTKPKAATPAEAAEPDATTADAETAADADEAATEKAESKGAAPKKSTTKAADADADAAPKRTRTTKKDE